MRRARVHSPGSPARRRECASRVSRRVALPFSALFLLSACGYHLGAEPRYASLALPVFENSSDRRLNEFDLTQIVARELLDSGVRLNESDAPYILKGDILDVREPRIVEGPQEVLRVGSVQMTIRLELVEKSTGRVLWTRDRTESSETAPARARTFEQARQEVFDRLAKWTARQMERPW